MRFSPISASANIERTYKRYLETIFQIIDPDYEEQFIHELDHSEVLSKGPYLDILDSFQKGKTIKELINEGVLPDSFMKLHLSGRPLYWHQENALRLCISGQNIVVSTGTGSGKTESFLLPILRDLVCEDEHGTLGPGVRALIIYPMNALANDQTERLRSILADYPAITFGSYTGQTEYEENRAIAQYRALNDGKTPIRNELISRERMVETPPNILITNYAMLEYLMIRPKENVFFNGRYSNSWKYVVLDEAHIYKGSTGIEVAMLLRRLKASIQPSSLQYILTSATLGDEDQNKQVSDFAQMLCNEEFTEDSVIRARRIKPEMDDEHFIDRPLSMYQKLAICINNEDIDGLRTTFENLTGIKTSYDIHKEIYDFVIEDRNYWMIRSILSESPDTVSNIARKIGCSVQEVEDLVSVAAFAVKNDAHLLDAKYHMFFRATDSAFITIGRYKKLVLTRHSKIFHDGSHYTVFEVAVCRNCHSIYLLGKMNQEGCFVQNSMSDAIEQSIVLYLGSEITDEDEDHLLEKEGISAEKYKLCPHCGKLVKAGIEKNNACDDPAEDYVSVYRIQSKEGALKKCVACESFHSTGILRRFFTGQEAVTSVIGTSLFENMPSSRTLKRKNDSIIYDEFGFDTGSDVDLEERETLAKQYIAFSDSRQAAAFFAIYFEQTYRSILYKRLIIETLKIRSGTENIEQFANNLQAVMEHHHVIQDESLSYKKEAWKAILAELVMNYSDNALQNLGFYKLTIASNSIPSAANLKLTNQEITDIINVCLQTMMQDAAIHYPVLMNHEEKEFFTFNGFEGTYVLSDNKVAKAFLPAKSNGLNKRLEYVQKIIAASVQKQDMAFSRRFLESLWGIMQKQEIIVSEGSGKYKVNVSKIQIDPEASFFQCAECKKITPYNVRGICPTYRCKGHLEKTDMKKLLEDNHYYHRYQETDIRSMRVVEHTAQLNRERAYEYQNLFKNKKIDVLSCSTTFELGVDVGSLETVFMRNMPPSPANYAQRAGRAGRSTESAAFAITFCNRSSHDFAFFNNPISMIRGKMNAPVFKVDNGKVGIRHVHASALGFFWRVFPQYFKSTSVMFDVHDGDSGINRFKKFLQSKPDALRKYLKSFLPESLQCAFDINGFGWVEGLLGENGILLRAENEYHYELSILKKAFDEALAKKGKTDYLQFRINNYESENILSFLSRKSVIPKYGFPVDTVELAIYDAKSQLKTNLQLQRDLAMAISEYAPGSQIIADGQKMTSQYIRIIDNFGWKMFDYKKCDQCNALNIAPHIDNNDDSTIQECKVCGYSLGNIYKSTFIVPEYGFQTGKIEPAGLIKPKRTYNNEVAYVGYRDKVEVIDVEDSRRHYRLIYSQNDQMAILNRSGFMVCERCGYTKLDNKNYKTIVKYEHNTPTGKTCHNQLLRRFSLGYRFETDVIQIEFCMPQIEQYEMAISLLYGIIKGACFDLDVEENDISGCVQLIYKHQCQSNYKLILYDRTPGGAGHVARMKDPHVFEEILKKTYNLMKDCNCGGEQADTSCYKCLRNYYNQRYHDILQRNYVMDFISNVL